MDSSVQHGAPSGCISTCGLHRSNHFWLGLFSGMIGGLIGRSVSEAPRPRSCVSTTIFYSLASASWKKDATSVFVDSTDFKNGSVLWGPGINKSFQRAGPCSCPCNYRPKRASRRNIYEY